MLGLGAVHAFALWRDNSDRRAAASAMAATGWLLLIALFVSPLCALTSALFSARVAHHAVLVAEGEVIAFPPGYPVATAV